VQGVKKHTSGRHTSYPDLASDFTRTLKLAQHISNHFSDVNHSLLLTEITKTVEDAEPLDTNFDNVFSALLVSVASQLSFSQKQFSLAALKHFKDVSTYTLLLTPSMWVTLALTELEQTRQDTTHFQKQLHTLKISTTPDVYKRVFSKLPGTRGIIILLDIIRIETDLYTLRSSTFKEEMKNFWENIKPVGTSFDAAVNSANVSIKGSEELAWAILLLESRRHTNLLWQQANKLARKSPEQNPSELMSWAWMGLRTALRLYDPALGFSFSTYACTRITGTMRDGIRSERTMPKRLTTFQRKVATVESQLLQNLGRTPTLDEIAEELGSERRHLEVLSRAANVASLEELSFQKNTDLPELQSSSDLPENDAWYSVCRDEINSALHKLPTLQARAIQLLVIEGRSATEAATLTDLSTRQLRQLKEKALSSLAEELSHLNV